MNLIEIVDKREQKIKELKSFTEVIKLEKREMNSDENTNFISLRNEVEELNKQIDDIKNMDAMPDVIDKKNNKRNMNTNFSLLRTIREISEGRAISDEALEMIKAGKEEFSKNGLAARGTIVLPSEFRADIVAQTAYAGQEIVAEEKGLLLGSLKARTVLGQAGAQFIKLVGDYSQPIYAGTASYWADEISGATNGGGAFSEVTFAPKRLVTQITISKQFLAQDSISAEATILQDLIDSILVKVENTALDGTAGGSTRPAGLFYGADYAGTLSGATSFAKLVGMKAAVDTANALTGNLCYITTPALYAVMETTPIDANGGGIMCLNNGKVAGYPVLSTSNVLSGKAVYGNFNDYIVAQWGGIDLVVDPYSKAGNGQVVITCNTFWDFKVRRSASFKLNQLS